MNITPFESSVEFEFWLKGVENPIQGRIADAIFIEGEDGKYETLLEIDARTKKFNVNFKDIVTWAEVKQAA